jgi:ubiquinone/menaquinone biosynthesis C-methylase UbiE
MVQRSCAETKRYYDSLSEGYDELYGKEQLEKSDLVKFADGEVLDLGCGTSIVTKLIRAEFIVGFDLSPDMIRKGRLPGVQYVVGRAETLPFKDGSFDTVVSITVLQDCENPKKVVSEIARTGAKAVISIPSKSRLDLKNMVEKANLEVVRSSTAGKDEFVYIKK